MSLLTVAAGALRATPPQAVCDVVHRRPRDLPEYQAACHATDRDVRELDACAVIPGMTAWHGGRWMRVTDTALDYTGSGVELRLDAHGIQAVRYADRRAPVYVAVEG